MYVKGNGNSWSELIEIKSVPASGNDPETIEKTTMKDAVKTYVLGRQDTGLQTFTFNYNETDYTAVKALDNAEHEFLVVLPDRTGTYIKGKSTVYRNEVSVNGLIEATLAIAPSEIEFKSSSDVTSMIGALSA